MDEELISKRELLNITGISYGQLYRWKRKNIIPEEWFIKKSSFTGQETFFPKDKIIERVNRIKHMKDILSLNELAEKFSPKLSEIVLTPEELIERQLLSQSTYNIYKTINNDITKLDFEQILYMSILERFLMSGEVSFEEGKGILDNLEKNYKNFIGKDCDIIFIRKFGIGISILIQCPNALYLEDTAKMVLKINISRFVEELKLRIQR